jgi:hypothetical protein
MPAGRSVGCRCYCDGGVAARAADGGLGDHGAPGPRSLRASDANDSSVHPSVIGRKVTVTADLDTVRIHCETTLVGEHQRCWALHQTISDPAHVTAAAKLRGRRRLATAAPSDDAGVAYRDLSDHDRILGLDGEVAS